MRLAFVHFDDLVTIPYGKATGGGEVRSHVIEASYDIEDGWEIDFEPSSKEFRIWREGMPEAVYLGGYGYTRIELPLGLHLVDEEQATEPKRKKR